MEENRFTQNFEEPKAPLQFVDEITSLRNNLLTFAFTTVLAVIGIAFANLDKDIPPLLYLLPHFLIIPFAARITYYRMNHAHKNSFLEAFYPNGINTQFARGTMFVQERQRQTFRLVSLLVNIEMLILGAACSVLFLVSAYEEAGKIRAISAVSALLPLFIIGVIIYQGYNYWKIKIRFLHKWELAKRLFGDHLEKKILPYHSVILPVLNTLHTVRGLSKSRVILYPAELFQYPRSTTSLLLTVLEDDRYLLLEREVTEGFVIKVKPKFILAQRIGVKRYLDILDLNLFPSQRESSNVQI